MLVQFGNNWMRKIPRTAKLDEAVVLLHIQHVVLLHILIVSVITNFLLKIIFFSKSQPRVYS